MNPDTTAGIDIELRGHGPKLLALACEYHRRTENFDRAVCRFKTSKGVAIPTTRQEWYECSDHAKRVYRELFRKSGATSIEWQSAVFKAARVDYP